MIFVYIHLIGFGIWIIVNLGWTPLPTFDPTLVVLAMFASVEAIFLSTFVLITQNRMAAQADRRADLDLSRRNATNQVASMSAVLSQFSRIFIILLIIPVGDFSTGCAPDAIMRANVIERLLQI